MTELEILEQILNYTSNISADLSWVGSTIDTIWGQMLLLLYANALMFGLLAVCTVFIVVGFIKRSRK